MHGRGGEFERLGQLVSGAGVVGDGAHWEFGVLIFDGDEQFGDIVGDLARSAAVCAGFGQQRIETAGTVALQPLADGFGGDQGAGGAGDDVLACGFVGDAMIQAFGAGFQTHQIGADALAEQGHGVSGIGI